MKKNTNRLILMLSLLPLSGVALAHPGHESSSLFSGFLHPLTGIDHIVALLAMGLWMVSSTQCQNRQLITPVLIALFAIIGGSVVALLGINLPVVGAGVAASVLIMGLLLCNVIRLTPMTGLVMISLFALLHGYSHGLAMPIQAQPFVYTAGLVVMSAMLLITGAGTGQLFQTLKAKWLIRGAGVLTSGFGAWLLLAA